MKYDHILGTQVVHGSNTIGSSLLIPTPTTIMHEGPKDALVDSSPPFEQGASKLEIIENQVEDPTPNPFEVDPQEHIGSDGLNEHDMDYGTK